MKIDVKYDLFVEKFQDNKNEYAININLNDSIYEYHCMIDTNEENWMEYLSELLY